MHVLLIVFHSLVFAESAKILGISHVATTSHFIAFKTLLHGLAEKGHEVTILSSFPSKEKIKNVKDIYLDRVENIIDEHRNFWTKANLNIINFYYILNNLTSELTSHALQSKAMSELLKTNYHYDIVIIEPFGNDAFFGLGHLFNAQIVVLSTASSLWVSHLAGSVAPYSFVPNSLSPFTDEMTFFQRISNSLSYILFNWYIKFLSQPVQKQLYNKFFKNAPSFEETIKNASLFLINSNIILETPRPYLPNMISVGGIHIQKPKKLPKDLEEFLDNATNGAILFSLGSFIQSKYLDKSMIQIILNAFAKLPQKVLWKFEEDLPETPNNLKIGKWLPQSDILAHPNIKLFITHGGLLSATEALYRGVPILGIPFYGDQYGHIKIFMKHGYGELLLFSNLTEETFLTAIKNVINNAKYSQNIKRHSAILNDQLQSPLERAIFWIEHIIKHGAKHLHSTSIDLSYIQYLLLDIIAFILLIIILIVIIIYFIFTTTKQVKKQDESKKQK